MPPDSSVCNQIKEVEEDKRKTELEMQNLQAAVDCARNEKIEAENRYLTLEVFSFNCVSFYISLGKLIATLTDMYFCFFFG